MATQRQIATKCILITKMYKPSSKEFIEALRVLEKTLQSADGYAPLTQALNSPIRGGNNTSDGSISAEDLQQMKEYFKVAQHFLYLLDRIKL